MQEKYLGDTPDFAKYALLKALCGSDLRLGINWYLTLPHEVDGIDNKDGETRHHASSSKSYRAIDQTLWEQLENFQHSDDRSISTFESSKVLPLRTKYFSEPLSFAGLQSKSEKLQARSDWVQRGLRKLKNTDLVFIDPDTGMEIPSKERHEKKGPKYAFYDELVPLIKRNQTLVLIQFVDRSGTEIQAQKVTKNIRTHTGFAGKLDIVRAKAGRAILFFILHSKKNSDRIISRLEKFLSGPALDRFYSVRIQEQSKNSKKLIKKAMAEGQKDHLRKLIKGFERVQTIQDALSDARLKADKLAEKLHEGQTDKSGNPYIDHVRDVADRVSSLGENYVIVGLLHDSVEDTDITLEKIEEEFGKDVRDGVDGMTKREGEDYFDDYLPRVASNEISRNVKIADSSHNLSKNHLLKDPELRGKLKQKYTSVLQFLGGSFGTIAHETK